MSLWGVFYIVTHCVNNHLAGLLINRTGYTISILICLNLRGKKKKSIMFKIDIHTLVNYRVASLSFRYSTANGNIMQGVKSIGQF